MTGYPTLSGLPHLPAVSHLHVNRPEVLGLSFLSFLNTLRKETRNLSRQDFLIVSFGLSFVLFIEFALLGQVVTILHFVRELGCRLPI